MPPSPPTPGFAALGLPPDLLAAAAALGWRRPTPVQAAAIPAILQGRDVLGLAPTGTGKTGAFALPLARQLMALPPPAAAPRGRSPRPIALQALVLSPTRELASQTGDVLRRLAPGFKTVVAVGGVSINPQMMALRGGAHLVVATPGRLLELVACHALSLSALPVLVLDEADRLLDAGFADELTPLLDLLPASRQTLLFSATWPDALGALARQLLRDAVAVGPAAGDALAAATNPAVAAATATSTSKATATATPAPAPAIQQRAIVVDTARRTPLLRHLLATEGWTRTLVFVATQYATEHVADKLNRAGIGARALHGRLSQGARTQALWDFRQGHLPVLVATDLAARGIDVAGLSAVVNHDLPRSAVDHTHRIGRTGRAGLAGVAVSLVCADAPGSEAHFRLIENRQGQRVPRETVPGFEPAGPPLPPLPADPNGGIKGRRKSKKDKLREAAAMAEAAERRPVRR